MKNTIFLFERLDRPVANTRRGFIKLLAPALVLASAWTAFANPHDGTGSMTVSPGTAIASSTGNSFVFSFRESPIHTQDNFPASSTVTIAVPSGWTAPQTTNSSLPGFVSTAAAGEAPPLGITLNSTAVSGTGPWTITVTFSSGNSTNDGFDLTYAGGNTEVTVPSATGVNTFTAKSKGGNGGAPTAIAVSPEITISAAQTINNQTPANITRLTTSANGMAQISFAGAPNSSYLIQATTNLAPPVSWTSISTNTSGTNGLFQFIDSDSTNFPMRFYRTATL
jgi:hypothetical protein